MDYKNWAQDRLRELREQSSSSEVNPELAKQFPPERLAKLKKRELRRFIERQGVKWQRWLESMSR